MTDIVRTEFKEKLIFNDPATSYWLKEQLEATKKRDIVDALGDAEMLVEILQGRLERLHEQFQVQKKPQ